MPVSEANRHAQSRDPCGDLHYEQCLRRHPEPERARDLACSGTTPAPRQIPMSSRIKCNTVQRCCDGKEKI